MAMLVAGKYRLKVAISQGPHGVLWLAQHEGTLEDLAVKVLKPEFADDRLVVERFIRERPILTAFLHPAYVRIRDLEAEVGSIALVTELVTGTDLGDELARSGPLPPETAAEIAAACADIVAAGHEAGVVHCDIKPTNILLTSDSRQVRLTDCRVARLARGRRVGPNRFADSRYAAPEVVLGGPPELGTDVYGIGLVLHEMVTGTPRVKGDHRPVGTPRHYEAPSTVDRRLRDIVEACLVLDPAQRPSGQWLAAELRAPSSGYSTLRPVVDLVAVARRGVSFANSRTTPRARQSTPRARQSTPRARPRPPGARPRSSALSVKAAIAAGVATLVVGVVVGTIVGRDESVSPPVQPTVTTEAPSEQPGDASTGAGPTSPSEAAAESGPGAIAFVQYWFDALSYAATTGDTRPLATASSPTCGACSTAIQSIGEAYANRSTVRGGVYTVRSVNMESFFDIRRPILRVVFDRGTRTTIDAAGREIDALSSVTFATCQLVLERAGTRWRVLDVQSSNPVA